MKSKWNSLIVKIMITFIMVILPLYGLSISLTYNSSGQMRGELERNNESMLQYHFSSLQFELSRMKSLVGQFSQDEELSDFSTVLPIMSRYEIVQRLNNILLKLKQMKSSSPYIQDVLFYLPALNKVVSVNDGVSGDPDMEWKGLVGSRGDLKGTVSEYNGNLYLLTSSPFVYNTSNYQPNFVLAIQISSEELNKQLDSFRGGNMNGAFLVFGTGTGNNKIVADGDMNDYWSALKAKERAASDGQVLRTITDRYHYYSVRDSVYQFEFVSLVSNDILYQPIHRYSLWMWGLTAASCLILIIFSYWIYRLIHKPLIKLVKGFKTLERGNTTQQIVHRREDEFGYLYSEFNQTIKRLDTLIEENYVHRIRTQDAELKHLQSQITPHFLYNSLFTIKQMAALEKTEEIQIFSDYLGQYFRFMTKDSAKEVTLRQEMEHSVHYLHIQQIRFSNRIRIQAEPLPEPYYGIMVPRIIFQPILENNFEHGLKQSINGGVLKLSHRTEEGAIVIEIEDNGQSLTDDRLFEHNGQLRKKPSEWKESETTGLLNVHHRLRIRFGDDYGLRLDRSELGGLRVAVLLPTNTTTKER